MKAAEMVGDDAKVCTACHETKPLDAFYKNKGGLAGRHSRCKPCFVRGMVMTKDHRKHQRARGAVWREVQAGRMVRPSTCSVCQREAFTHGHHDDYDRPLDVRWLCPPCHEIEHLGDKYDRHDVTLPMKRTA